MLHDLRYAWRSLLRAPGFTTAAIVTLALGIGANSAMFSVLDALLLKPLPVTDPNALYVLLEGGSYRSFLRFRQRTDLFTGVLASSGVQRADLRIGELAIEPITMSLVSGEFFRTLGVRAVAGRTFDVNDDQKSATPVAVVSYGFWQRRFAGDPALVGRAITVNHTRVTIVGIVPQTFFGERVGARPELWIPLSLWSQVVPGRDLTDPIASANTAWLQVIGRLAPTTTVDHANAALTLDYRRVLTDSFGPRIPDDVRPYIERATVTLDSAARGTSLLRMQYALAVQLLMGAVALVLLMACANLANMLLIRAVAARRAVGIQLAMGIGRSRLVRALLTEPILLCVAGAALSVPVARWTTSALLSLISRDSTPIPLNADFDVRVWLFTGTVCALTIVAIGLVPALKSTRIDVLTALRHGPGNTSARGGPRSLLLIAQVACAIVLLVTAALLARTLANLHASDLGFVTDRLVVVDIDPRKAGYGGERYRALAARLLERLKNLPGAAAATQTENGVLAGRDSSSDRMRPAALLSAAGLPRARFDFVGPDYFRTLGIPLVGGRDFRDTDGAASPRVLIVSQAMARHYFGDRTPIGERMLWRDQVPWEIVGVAADVKQSGPRDEEPLRFWVPYTQQPGAELASIRYAIRTSADADAMVTAIRNAVTIEDSALSVESIDSATDLLDRSLTRDRAVTTVASVFGLLAAAIAGIGLYATLSYSVARRRAELAMRSAIGARPRDLARLVLTDSAQVMGIGVVLGVAGAVTTSQLLTRLLFGLSPTDARTYLTVVVALTAVAFAASYSPARRAARTQPLAGLRAE